MNISMATILNLRVSVALTNEWCTVLGFVGFEDCINLLYNLYL